MSGEEGAQWIARYDRYRQPGQEECDSLRDAIAYLAINSDYGDLAERDILAPDGSVALAGEELGRAVEAFLAEMRAVRKERENARSETQDTLHAILARPVRALDGEWGTTRAVTVLRAAGVGPADQRAAGKQARAALRALLGAGLLVRVPSPGNTAVYRRAGAGSS